MDRKHGKYVVNVEHSENQSPITCSVDQEAHSSACWHRPSNDTTGHVSSSLTGLYVSPGVLVHSQCPHIELSNTQVMFDIAASTQVGMCSLQGRICSILSQEIYLII
ncbi:unnamed protein product [Gulo gulo]|uniref:Uncharacterized protein n=1 Tax=Gulo gulo TaxID=48420 RepID=A0A9X9LWE9_GULGU|nr:unnamed protein product [Gulo gulo]